MPSLTDPKLLWYLNRSSGLVLLVVFTLAIVLGQYATRRRAADRTPRFVWLQLHRNVSLLGLVLLVLHVVTSVADDYVDISPADAVLPFVSGYRPFWLGLGTVSLDLLVAIGVSTALRHRIRPTAWRTVHRLAYLMWPVAALHGVGIGTDTRHAWSLWITLGCLAVVLAATLTRTLLEARDRFAELTAGPPTTPGLAPIRMSEFAPTAVSLPEPRWPR